jgi:membrane protein involved in colicin uptake
LRRETAAQQAAAAATQKKAATAAAEQKRQMELTQKRQADEAAAAEVERQRITADNARVSAENASYDQAREAAAVSQISGGPAGATATGDQTTAMRRRRGRRTSILAGDTGSNLGGTSSTLG